MWHVSSSSGVATLRTAIQLLLTYLHCRLSDMKRAVRFAAVLPACGGDVVCVASVVTAVVVAVVVSVVASLVVTQSHLRTRDSSSSSSSGPGQNSHCIGKCVALETRALCGVIDFALALSRKLHNTQGGSRPKYLGGWPFPLTPFPSPTSLSSPLPFHFPPPSPPLLFPPPSP